MTIAEFLLARLAEDEAVALACLDVNQRVTLMRGGTARRWARDGSAIKDVAESPDDILRVKHTWAREAEHIARHDPARVLADCRAKRRIVELHEREHECTTYDHTGDINRYTYVLDPEECSTLRLLASVYFSHPNYDSAWSVPDA